MQHLISSKQNVQHIGTRYDMTLYQYLNTLGRMMIGGTTTLIMRWI